MKSLPDFLRPGLSLLSVGLNPSPASVRAGFYFANPRNRFWRALEASGLAGHGFEPGPDAHRLLLQRGLGFTDLVKRTTSGAGALRSADYRDGAPGLKAKIEAFRPGMLWFHGRVAMARYLHHGEGVEAPAGWGLLGSLSCGIPFFVTPNPSPANARFSLDELTRWYAALAAELETVHG
ncbi:MAG: mismatch-specific DNA-glycosylase [Gammaproteobacteria bacterium]|nr:MAG: mismatch-specific DNA-glycosylase [Gammaproteobacteria bacterium]